MVVIFTEHRGAEGGYVAYKKKGVYRVKGSWGVDTVEEKMGLKVNHFQEAGACFSSRWKQLWEESVKHATLKSPI